MSQSLIRQLPQISDLISVNILICYHYQKPIREKVFNRQWDKDSAGVLLSLRILVLSDFHGRRKAFQEATSHAEKIHADLIVNATDVSGVYDKNPNIHKDAQKLVTLTFDQLQDIIRDNASQDPGEYGLFDMKAVKKAKRLKIPIVFINGTNPEEIIRAVDGTHCGSTVTNELNE